jgi:hypothetical protein
MKQYYYKYFIPESNMVLNTDDIERLNKLGQKGWGVVAKFDYWLLLMKEVDLDSNL